MSNAVVIEFQPRRQPGRDAPTTVRCTVGSKPSPWSKYLDWNWYHRWPRGERATGRCLNCGKTLQEMSVARGAAIVIKFQSRV